MKLRGELWSAIRTHIEEVTSDLTEAAAANQYEKTSAFLDNAARILADRIEKRFEMIGIDLVKSSAAAKPAS